MAILPVGESLPLLVEPDEMTPIQDDCRESLVDVSNTFTCIEAYRNEGWQHAHQGTFLRNGVARRLLEVIASLPFGFDLVIFDGWRSLDLQSELFAAAYGNSDLPEGYLAPPTRDVRLPPPHVSGGTVDLTLSFEGTPLALGTAFDSFTDEARTLALESDDTPVRRLRRLLCSAMWAQDFIVYEGEWWHFEYGTPRWAAIRDKPGCYQGANLEAPVSFSSNVVYP